MLWPVRVDGEIDEIQTSAGVRYPDTTVRMKVFSEVFTDTYA